MEMKKPYVDINGQQIPTMNYVFEQMMAQSCRIDRANLKSTIASIMAAVAIMIAAWALAS